MYKEEHTYKGFGIRIMQDLDAENPRQWGRLGTIISIDGTNEVEKHVLQSIREDVNRGHSEKESLKEQFPNMVWFHKLYRYSHGGDIWALHDNFPDRRWDVSHAGYVVVTREDIREWYNRQHMSDKLRERIYEDVARQLEEVTNWANGNVYGFFIDVPDPNFDGVFYGGYNNTNKALEDAKVCIDNLYHELTKEVKYA